MTQASFQSIILKLQDFWALHGCLITQPCYTQAGAGAMNSTVFLGMFEDFIGKVFVPPSFLGNEWGLIKSVAKNHARTPNAPERS